MSDARARSRAEERLRVALERHASRFESARPDWTSIEARRRAASRAVPARQKLAWMAAPGVAAAVLLLVAAVLPDTRTPAQSGPLYLPVAPAPTFPAGTTMAAIQERGSIRVGIKFDQPRFGEKNEAGTVEGFDAEIAKLMAVGIFGGTVADVADRIEFVPAVSREREALLQTGKVDIVVATYSITPERGEKVDFAGPYFRARQDIMVKAGDASIRSVDDLSGKRVCTARGSTSFKNLLSRNPNAQVVERDTYSECATALSAGEVDAVTTDQPILAGYAQASSGAFRVLNNPFSDELYGIGIQKGDDAFRSFLNQRLREIEENGDWARAANYSLADVYLPPTVGVTTL